MRVRTRLAEAALTEMPLPDSAYPAIGQVLARGLTNGDITNPDKLAKSIEQVHPSSLGTRVKYAPIFSEFAKSVLKDGSLSRKLGLPSSLEAAITALEEKYREQIIRLMTTIERHTPEGGGYARYQ